MVWFGFLGGLWMGDRKRKSGVWHHRVPDFRLVYCEPEEGFPEKETKHAIRKEVAVITDKHDSEDRRAQQQKKID